MTAPAKVYIIGSAAQIAEFDRHNRQYIVERRKMHKNPETGLFKRYYLIKTPCNQAQDMV